MDVDLVLDLLQRQHPDFADYEIREAASGFDNTIWRLGDDFVVRLPRRAVAAVLMEHELRWLPEVAPRLPLQIPEPVRNGLPSERFVWPWSIAKWIHGTSGNLVDESTLRNAATPLGEFLRALHVAAPPSAPFNTFRSAPLQEFDSTLRGRLVEVGQLIDRDSALKVWCNALAASAWTSSSVWIHGDLHPANTVWREGAIIGVIDFGDLCAGDPATDLAGALLSIPYDFLGEFFDAYGTVDLATMRRTLGWAIHFGLMFTLLGIKDEPTYAPIGRRALTNALALSQTLTS